MQSDLEQRSAEWFEMRRGKFTASNADRLMSNGRKTGEFGQKFYTLIDEIAVERLIGKTFGHFVSPAMQRGTELEPQAIAAYEFTSGNVVDPAFFVLDGDIAGCSPDGYVGDDGLVEAKCPENMAKHLNYLHSATHAEEYRWQLQFQLCVTKRAWVDIVSYHPEFPPHLQVAIERVEPNTEDFHQIRVRLVQAETLVKNKIQEIQDQAAAA
ncbi:MAG: lambda exonuclease family protein [Pseudomonadota bacterium]